MPSPGTDALESIIATVGDIEIRCVAKVAQDTLDYLYVGGRQTSTERTSRRVSEYPVVWRVAINGRIR